MGQELEWYGKWGQKITRNDMENGDRNGMENFGENGMENGVWKAIEN